MCEEASDTHPTLSLSIRPSHKVMNGSHDDSLASSNLRCTASPSPCGLKLLYDSDSEMLLDHSCELKCQHRHGSLTTSFPLEKHQQDMCGSQRGDIYAAVLSRMPRDHIPQMASSPLKAFFASFTFIFFQNCVPWLIKNKPCEKEPPRMASEQPSILNNTSRLQISKQ